MPLPPPKWKPQGVFDALAQTHIPSNCDECGRKLRFAHRIVEVRGPRTLHVGVCCASRLCSGTEYDPRAAERQTRNRAGRLRTFLSGFWRVNEKGNLVRRYRQAIVTVYAKAGWWGFCVKVRRCEAIFSNRLFRLAEEAKGASFEMLEQATSKIAR